MSQFNERSAKYPAQEQTLHNNPMSFTSINKKTQVFASHYPGNSKRPIRNGFSPVSDPPGSDYLTREDEWS